MSISLKRAQQDLTAKKIQITSRADLNIGLICNLRCKFCYDLDTLNISKGPSIEELRRQMGFLKKNGIDTVDITGGEATLRKDLTLIIKMVKEEFAISNICIITNGYKLADLSYMKEVMNAGVNEFLFSIQGASTEVHDRLVDVKGSFERVMKALKNACDLGARVRINTTVTVHNYDKVLDIAEMISHFNIKNYNLIMFSPLLDAADRSKELAVQYSIAAPFLKKVIDQYHDHIEHISIKLIPYCFMQGYEKYVINLVQTSYTLFDWDFCIRSRRRKGQVLYGLSTIAGVCLLLDFKQIWSRSIKEILRDAFLSFQEVTTKHKPFKCRSCKFSPICSGVWNEYSKDFGVDELIPVKGAPIFKPYHFYEKMLGEA